MKVLAAFLFLTILLGCQGSEERLSQKKAFDLTQRAIIHFKLTSLPIDCLSFEEVKDQGYYTWLVREKHNQKCGGDPGISPRLFTIRTNQKTGKITSDAQNEKGEMEKLK